MRWPWRSKSLVLISTGIRRPSLAIRVLSYRITASAADRLHANGNGRPSVLSRDVSWRQGAHLLQSVAQQGANGRIGFDEVAKSGLTENFMYQDSVGCQREKLLVSLPRLAQRLLYSVSPTAVSRGRTPKPR